MRHAFRSLAVSLALCAMLLRALLPEGWMPAAGASPFVICSVAAKAPDGKAPGDPQQRSHAPCAFAVAAPLSPPAAVAALGAAGSAVVRLAATFADDDFFHALRHRPNAARAPPALS